MKSSVYLWLVISMLFCPELSAQIRVLSETNLTNNSSDDRYASYSPDGKRIVFESNRDNNWQIYIMNADGSSQKKLTSGTSNNRQPSWHPGGSLILFESDRSGKIELYTLNIRNAKVRQVTSIKNGDPVFAEFSPDGQSIAISLQESEDKSEIVLLNRRGDVSRQLTDNNARSYYPRWSANGKEIIYFSRKDTENQDDEIYKLDLETGEEKRLTNWPKHNFCPAWSGDNSRIVYVTSMDEIRPELYIMNSDGTNPLRITYNEEGETLPFWSPDGKKILVTAFRKDNYEVCELQLEFN